jgi:hypothetical protein
MRRIFMVVSGSLLLTVGLAWALDTRVNGGIARNTVGESEATQIYGGQSNCPLNSPDGTYYCIELCSGYGAPANTYCEMKPYYGPDSSGTTKGNPYNDDCEDCGTNCGSGQDVSCSGS